MAGPKTRAFSLFAVAGLEIRACTLSRHVAGRNLPRPRVGRPTRTPVPRDVGEAKHNWIEPASWFGDFFGHWAPVFANAGGELVLLLEAKEYLRMPNTARFANSRCWPVEPTDARYLFVEKIFFPKGRKKKANSHAAWQGISRAPRPSEGREPRSVSQGFAGPPAGVSPGGGGRALERCAMAGGKTGAPTGGRPRVMAQRSSQPVPSSPM